MGILGIGGGQPELGTVGRGQQGQRVVLIAGAQQLCIACGVASHIVCVVLAPGRAAGVWRLRSKLYEQPARSSVK